MNPCSTFRSALRQGSNAPVISSAQNRLPTSRRVRLFFTGFTLYVILLLFSARLTGQTTMPTWCDVPENVDWPNLIQCGELELNFQFVSSVVCNGEPVTIKNNNPPSSADSSIVCWGDGTYTAMAGTPAAFTHNYAFPADTCPGECLTFKIRLAIIRHCSPNLTSFLSFTRLATVCFPPKADFTLDPVSVCTDEPVNIDDNSCKNSPQTMFAWSMPGAQPNQTSASESPGPISYPTAGTYSVSLTLTNPGNPAGCKTSTATHSVSVAPPATAAFTAPDTVCAGETIMPMNTSQNASAPTGSPYKWTQISGPSGGLMFILPSLDTDKEPKFKFTKKGTYKIRLSVKGCHNPFVEKVIIVRDRPSASPSLPSGKCAPYTLTINVTNWPFDAGDFPAASLAYLWKITRPDGSMATYPTQYPPPVNCDQPGTYTISVTVSNGCGPATISKDFIVGRIIDADFTFSSPSDNCVPKTIVFTNTTTGSNPIYQLPTVTGGPAGGAALTANLPTGFSITFSKAGTYTVSLTASNNCPSSDTRTATLTFYDKPTVNAFTVPGPCEGELVVFNPANLNISTGGLPCNCQYVVPGIMNVTLPCTQTPPAQAFPGAGPYLVTLTVSNSCDTIVKTATLNFSKKPIPVSVVPNKICLPDALVCTDNSQAFTANPLRTWSVINSAGTIVATSSDAVAIFTGLPIGTYTIRLEVGNGCGIEHIDKTVHIYASPTAILTVDNDHPCGSGAPIIDFNYSEGGAPASFTWNWVNADGTPGTAPGALPPAPFFDRPGTYAISVTISNGECLNGNGVVAFTVDAIPVADVVATAIPHCLDPVPSKNRIKFDLPALAGVQYLRTITPNAGWHYVNGNDVSASAEIQIDACGIYAYNFTTSNHCGTETWARTDTFYKSQTATLPILPNACKQTTLDLSGTNFDWGCDPSRSVRWTFAAGSPAFSTDLIPQGIGFMSNSAQTFPILLTIYGACDTLTFQTLLSIEVPEVVTISPNPLKNCANNAPIPIAASVSGGSFYWNNQPIPALFPPPGFPVGAPSNIVFRKNAVCVTTDSISGIVYPAPSADAGPDITVCVEKQYVLLSPGSNAPAPVFSWQSSNPAVTFAGDTAFFSNVLTASLTLTVTDLNGCTNTNGLTLTVLNNEVLTLPAPYFLCNTADTLELPLVNQKPGLLFSGPGVTADGRHFVPFGLGPNVTLYWVNTNAAGCSASGDFMIEIRELLNPPPNAGDPVVICQNDLPFHRDALPNVSGMQWLQLSGGIASSTATLTIAPSIYTQDQFIQFIAAYLDGTPNCAQYDTVEFHLVYAQPDAGPDLTKCLNDPPFQLTPANTPPPGFTFYWSPGDSIDPANGNQADTLHFVGFGCDFTDEVSIFVNDLPGSAFSITPPYCSNLIIDFINNTPSANSQKWFDNGILFATDIDPQDVQLDSGLHIIRLESWTGANCHDAFEDTIFVKAPPTLACVPDKTEGCGPLAVTYTYTATSQDELYFEVWLNGVFLYKTDATGSPQTLPDLPNQATDVTYTVKLIAKNDCLSVVRSFEILVKARAKADFGYNQDTLCNNNILRILCKSTNSKSDTLLYIGQKFLTSPTETDSFVVRNETEFPLTITLCLIAGNDCNTDTFCHNFTIMPNEYEALAETYVDLNRICETDSVQLTGHATAGANTYWRNLQTNALILGNDVWAIAEKGANEWVFYAEGCGFDTDTIRFNGRPAPPLLPDFLPDACPGVAHEFNAITAIGAGICYIFPPNDTVYGTPTERIFTTVGPVPFRIIAKSPEGCLKRVDTLLTVRPIPSIPVSLVERCTQEEGFTLKIDTTGKPTVWVKSGSGNTQNGYTFNRLQPDHYQIHYIERTYGCANDTVVNIGTVHAITAMALPDTTTEISLGDGIEFFVEGDYIQTVFWTRGEWLDDFTSIEPMATPEKTGCFDFIVTAADGRGCFARDTVRVCVVKEKVKAALPSAFTPNRDGHNDTLYPRIKKDDLGVVSMEFWVYDLFGELVFQAAEACKPNEPDFPCGWDGTFRGQEAVMGNYRALLILHYLDGDTSTHTKIIRLIR